MKISLGSTFAIPRNINAKINDSWQPVKQRYIKINGIWKMLNPPNLIVMYYGSAPDTSVVCNYDGSVSHGVPNLDGKYPRGDGTVLQTSAGNMSHSGTSHGSGQRNAVSLHYSTMGDAGVGFTDGALDRQWAHYHELTAHNHTTTTVPTVDTLSVVPTMGDDVIRSNAIILANQDTTLSGLTDMTASWLYKYLKFASSYGTSSGTMASHGHGNASWRSNTKTGVVLNQKQPNGGIAWQYSHYHNSDSHGIGTATVAGPVAHHLSAHKITSTTFFSDLPSGSIMAFTNTSLPPGWTQQVYYFIRIWKTGCSSAESDSHYHNPVTYSLTASISTDNRIRGTKANKNTEWVVNSHTHSFTDQHKTAVGNILPYIRLVWAKKN